MFNFGAFKKSDIFSIDDIRQLVLSFPQKAAIEESNPVSEHQSLESLVPLTSGSGFLQLEALCKAFRKFLDGKYGRIPVSAIAADLDVSQEILIKLAQEEEDIIVSRNLECVLTRGEQTRVSEVLQNKASKAFIPLHEISRALDVGEKDIAKLVLLSENSSEISPLQYLSGPEQNVDSTDVSGYPYIHTLTTLLNIKGVVLTKLHTALDDAKTTTWTESEFLGLSSTAFYNLARDFVKVTDEYPALHGSFEHDKDTNEVRFIPQTFLLRKANQSVEEVARGALPFCDLTELTRTFPTLLTDTQSAKKFVESHNQADGSPCKFHFMSHYAIGDTTLNNTARIFLEILGSQRFVNTQPFLQSFPASIHEDAQILLIHRTELLFRSLGGSHADLQTFGPYLIQSTFIGDLELVSHRVARQVVSVIWETESDVPSSQVLLATPSFLQQFAEESGIEMELLSQLWQDKNRGIYLSAKKAYDQRLAELRTSCQTQLVEFWRPRVTLKVQLHTKALGAMEEGPLKEQLQDLLSTHVAQDLIRPNIKRATAKRLSRTQQIQKAISKLESALTFEKKDISSPLDALAKFNKKMDIEPGTIDELENAKREHVEEILSTMRKDSDGARLFLGTIICLFASRRPGVLYATGKFAPRILTLMKSELSVERLTRLEEIKSAIKAGTTEDGMKEELIQIAQHAISEKLIN